MSLRPSQICSGECFGVGESHFPVASDLQSRNQTMNHWWEHHGPILETTCRDAGFYLYQVKNDIRVKFGAWIKVSHPVTHPIVKTFLWSCVNFRTHLWTDLNVYVLQCATFCFSGVHVQLSFCSCWDHPQQKADRWVPISQNHPSEQPQHYKRELLNYNHNTTSDQWSSHRRQ